MHDDAEPDDGALDETERSELHAFPQGEVKELRTHGDRPRRRYVVRRGPAPARLRHLPPIDESHDDEDDEPAASGAPWRRKYRILDRPVGGRLGMRYYIASDDAMAHRASPARRRLRRHATR